MRKIVSRGLASTVVIFLSATCSPVTHWDGGSQAEHVQCGVGNPPNWLREGSLAAGRVLRGTTHVGAVFRDPTVTVLGICPARADIAHSPPLLVDGATRLRPVGGERHQRGSHRVEWLLYPRTEARHVAVNFPGSVRAVAEFPPQIRAECDKHSTRQELRILACGALVVARWNIEINVDSKSVEVVDTIVTDGAADADLGFYLLSVKPSRPVGMSITFAFRPPNAALVTAELRGLILSDGSVVDPLNRPSSRITFELVG